MSILVVCAGVGAAAGQQAGKPPATQTPPQTPPAAAQPLPPARDVVGRHVAAIGGTDALSKVSSFRARGAFEIVDQKVSGTVEFLRGRPAKFVTRVTSDVGNSERGYDGKVGWTVDASGAKVLAGRQLREIAEEADADAILHLPSTMKELTTVERTRFDNRPVYKVRAVFTSGTQQLEYYDTETGLLLGVECSRELPAPFGVVPTVTTFREYKVFGGVKFATVVIQRSIGLTQSFKWTSFEFEGVPASAFDLPLAVKTLVR
jgi:hypothetical protein